MKGATRWFCSAEVPEIGRHEAPRGFGVAEKDGRNRHQPSVIPRPLEPFDGVVHLVLSHVVLSRGSFESKPCKEEPEINSS